jgi:hypothetical protein
MASRSAKESRVPPADTVKMLAVVHCVDTSSPSPNPRSGFQSRTRATCQGAPAHNTRITVARQEHERSEKG